MKKGFWRAGAVPRGYFPLFFFFVADHVRLDSSKRAFVDGQQEESPTTSQTQPFSKGNDSILLGF